MAYRTLAGPAECEREIRGSRFRARVAPIEAPEEAATHLAAARADHPDATHHVTAWRFGDAMGADDDGEPGGTSGRPMLEVLLKRDVDRVAIVCIRWFGGTRLGAGGLVRAYAGTAAMALDAAGTRTVHATTTLRVRIGYAHVDVVRRLLADRPHVRTATPAFDADGAYLDVEVRTADRPAVEDALRDATHGSARVEEAPRPVRP